MSMQMSANVDVECRQGSLQMSMEMSKTYRFFTEKNTKKPESYVGKMQKHMLIYIYIHIHTHTHTHPQEGSFFKHFHERQYQKLGNDSKKCQYRLKRPANIEHMSMTMVAPNVDPMWSTSVYTLSLWLVWATPRADFAVRASLHAWPTNTNSQQ